MFEHGDMYGAGGEFGGDAVGLYASVLKALNIDGSTPSGATNANALQVQDLSGTMASAELREKQLHFWKSISKKDAITANVEWARLDDLGDLGETGFIGSTDAGNVGDPVFARGSQTVKYMAVKGSVGLPTQHMQAVGLNGRGQNIMQTSEYSRMTHLLRLIERNLFFASERVDSLEFNGLFQQIDAAATVDNGIRFDMRGQVLDYDSLINMARIFAANNADPSRVFLPNTAYLDLQQSLFPRQRDGSSNPSLTVGENFDAYVIMSIGNEPSTCKIRRTQMLQSGVKGGIPYRIPSTAPTTAPTRPDSVTGTNLAHTATTSEPGLDAGTFYYTVTSVGKGGRSLGRNISAAATPSAGEKVRLTITGTDEDVRFYEIFRNKSGVSGVSTDNRKYMCRVKRTGSTVLFDDTGYYMPDTMHAGIVSTDADELYVKNLLGPVKRALPQSLMANDYGILVFLAFVAEVPTHNMHVVNIGSRTQSGFGTLGNAITGVGA